VASGTPEETGSPVGRRVVLGIVGLGAVGVAVGSVLQRGVDKVLAHAPSGVTDFIPAAGGFRYYSVVDSVRNIHPGEYTLSVSGLVDKPLKLSYADLGRLPQTRFVRDFQCVTGWRVYSVPWSGVVLSKVLDAAGVKPTAKAVRFISFDGTYTESLTLDQARRPDMLVATKMFDKPVTHEHGGPVRLYAAPMYGYKSCKWLGGIQVVDRVEPGYWENLGYDVDAWVGKSNGRDDERTS
jgi:DMSO/TMAO reductase YedYZ molybdopterin-dependent catalytic subunit